MREIKTIPNVFPWLQLELEAAAKESAVVAVGGGEEGLLKMLTSSPVVRCMPGSKGMFAACLFKKFGYLF